LLHKSSQNSHISCIFTTEHTYVGRIDLLKVLTKYYKTHDIGLSYFYIFCLWNNGLAKLYQRPGRLVSIRAILL